LGLPDDHPLLKDAEIEEIIANFHRAAWMAWHLGFDFVDIKHCHGYLGHEFLGAHTREGRYGGSFENRTRFLREVVQGIRSHAPELAMGVRLSAFDTIPFLSDPKRPSEGKPGTGIPEKSETLIPYRWAFGVNPLAPTEEDLTETIRFLSLLEQLEIRLVNITAGSPYYNPHIQRPALYPPSDGWCGSANGSNTTFEKAFSKFDFCGIGVQLPAGFSAERGPGRRASGMGRRSWAGANGIDLP
jgi:2,4-dienoyl-CoA reductase-like NADH-dependent reductase (Old Yellow Enzyme family)